MPLLSRLAASVSLYALAAASAAAHPLIVDPAHPTFTVSPESVAQSPAARDKARPRVFNIVLKPGHEAAAGAVETYFRSFGFRTRYFARTGSIELRGSYAEAERAGGFRYVPGRLPRTPWRAEPTPNFPDAIAGAILATTLEPGPVMEPQLLLGNNAPSTLPVYHDPVTGKNVAGLGPADYASLYGYANLYNFRSPQAPAGINGAGQIVDIAACYGWLQHGVTAGADDDITQFQSDFGLSPAPNITAFYPSGPGAYSTSSEPLLDLSRVYATAPGAMIRIWFAPTCTMGEFTNLFLDIANDQTANPAAALTVSYGLPETLLFDNYGANFFTGMDQALARITGAGQSVALFAASGDNGDNSANNLVLGIATAGTSDVMYPASDPNVLAVGGTAVFPVSATNVARQAETAWSGAAILNYGGSGGGISNIWPIPAWQVCGLGTGACGPQASASYKNVPDVALNASLQSAVLMVQQHALLQTGGTSAAAPTWAATVALLQQYETCCGSGHPDANYPAILYSPQFYPKWLTPISVGSNGRYAAQPMSAANPMGYGNVTGLGVPCFLHFPQPCAGGR